MTTILVTAVTFSIFLTFFCSMSEAAIFTVPLPYVRHLASEGSKAGKILLRFKDDMSRPVSAILILNTLSATTGAAVAGWAAAEVFGSRWLAVFSVAFTLVILYFSEITPKMIGVSYCRPVARFVALPWHILITLLTPLIWVTKGISRLIASEKDQPLVSSEEVLSMAALGTEEGALDHFEGSVITNVIGLDKLLVRDVLTPRVVVVRFPEQKSLGEIKEEIEKSSFSRIPLYAERDPDHLTAYVTRRDIYRNLLQNKSDLKLKDIGRPLQTVPELMRVDKLLLQMFEKKEQLCSVVDEHGALAGIITLEDIIEEIVGREIVDEYDSVSDLRSFAKVLVSAQSRKRK